MKLCRWILTLTTPIMAGMAAYSGIIIFLIGSLRDSNQMDNELLYYARFLLMGAGPLALGILFLLALWLPEKKLTGVALLAAVLSLLAAAMVAMKESLAGMSPMLVYLAGLMAYFAAALYKSDSSAANSSPLSPIDRSRA